MAKYEHEQSEPLEYLVHPEKVDQERVDYWLERWDNQRGQGLPTETVEGETEPEYLVNPVEVDMEAILKKIQDEPRPYSGG